jgi:hypothetical protein
MVQMILILLVVVDVILIMMEMMVTSMSCPCSGHWTLADDPYRAGLGTPEPSPAPSAASGSDSAGRRALRHAARHLFEPGYARRNLYAAGATMAASGGESTLTWWMPRWYHPPSAARVFGWGAGLATGAAVDNSGASSSSMDWMDHSQSHWGWGSFGEHAGDHHRGLKQIEETFEVETSNCQDLADDFLTADQLDAEFALHILSLSILLVFAAQLGSLMFAYGTHFFTTPSYLFDLMVVGVALVLDVGVDLPFGHLGIILLFWRVLRVVHGLYTTFENHHKNFKKKDDEERETHAEKLEELSSKAATAAAGADRPSLPMPCR